MSFDMLIGTISSHLSLLPEVIEMTSFDRYKPVSQVLGECWPIVQVELTSRYLDLFLLFQKWSFLWSEYL